MHCVLHQHKTQRRFFTPQSITTTKLTIFPCLNYVDECNKKKLFLSEIYDMQYYSIYYSTQLCRVYKIQICHAQTQLDILHAQLEISIKGSLVVLSSTLYALHQNTRWIKIQKFHFMIGFFQQQTGKMLWKLGS